MFELNQLRGFIAVATELNFRRAAQKLNMTQPPLSRQIQMLERQIGVQLFDRAGRSIQLTTAGTRFFNEAQDILSRAEAAALSARRANLGDEGSVVLGFIPIAALALLPNIMTLLEDSFPAVEVVVKEMQTIDQVEALSSGAIDLGIMRMPRDRSRLNLSRLHREPYVLAIHRDHELANKERPVIQDLHCQDFLMYAPSDGWYGYEKLNWLFVEEEVKPKSVQYFGQTITILSMVNAGVGLALVPASGENLGFENIEFKPLDLASPVLSEHFLGWSNASAEKPVIQRVRSTMINSFQHPLSEKYCIDENKN